MIALPTGMIEDMKIRKPATGLAVRWFAPVERRDWPVRNTKVFLLGRHDCLHREQQFVNINPAFILVVVRGGVGR